MDLIEALRSEGQRKAFFASIKRPTRVTTTSTSKNTHSQLQKRGSSLRKVVAEMIKDIKKSSKQSKSKITFAMKGGKVLKPVGAGFSLSDF